MCNSSHFGDSRVTMPFGHIKRDKLRVKGGIVPGHDSFVLVADIDIKQLRYFQIHNYSNSSEFNNKNGTDYKPLPPDYPFELAKVRHDSKAL